jgi:MFS transporter, DHA1 family, multidrug resistance protein
MFFFTIILIEILAGAEIDLFVPSFPELQQVFNLTPFEVELTLSVNLIAHCITALIVGTMGDKYGRKPVLLISLFIFIIGSVFCSFAAEFWHLIFGRLLQGVGISGPMVLAFLVVADLYSIKEQQRIMGIMNGMVTLAMAFAPVLGSYITLYFHWHGNFIVLLVLGIICFILCIFYIPKGKSNHDVSISLKEYIPVLKSKKTMLYVIGVFCFMAQGYWTFIGISPILFMDGLGVSLKHFGFYQGAQAGLFAIASLSCGYLFKKFGTKKCFDVSIFMLGLFIVGDLLLIFFDVRDPMIITIVLATASASLAIPFSILWPLSLETMPNAKGKITALFTSIRLIMTAISLQIVSYFYNGSFVHLGIIMFLGIAISLWSIHKILKYDDIFRDHEEIDAPPL